MCAIGLDGLLDTSYGYVEKRWVIREMDKIKLEIWNSSLRFLMHDCGLFSPGFDSDVLLYSQNEQKQKNLKGIKNKILQN